jgi:hypothetical protein
MGPAGTGKTHSIGTLVDAGIEVFYIGLEPGLESLLGYYTDKGKEIPANLHWHILEAPKASFTEFLASSLKLNTMGMDTLAKMQDPNRSKHDQFLKFIEVLNDFEDQRTGEKFGCIDTWDASRAVVIDGMTGLCRAAMSLVVGGKPMRSQADWGLAQIQVETILRMITDNCKCHSVVLAHVERETDAVLGGVKIMMMTLGKALSPKIAPMFSDVILTVREGSKFSWDTGSSLADVRTRNLPIAQGINADFGQIINKWKSRGGVA